MPVLRIVIKNGFSMDMARLLVSDIRNQVKELSEHPQDPIPLVGEQARESFRH
jgi:hypothetical protein